MRVETSTSRLIFQIRLSLINLNFINKIFSKFMCFDFLRVIRSLCGDDQGLSPILPAFPG